MGPSQQKLGEKCGLRLLRQFRALQRGGVQEVPYRLKGKLSLEDQLLSLPFSREGTISLSEGMGQPAAGTRP